MSKLQCECGCVMVARTMEEEFLYDFVPQKVIVGLLNKWEAVGAKFSSDDFLELYNEFRRDAYKCPSCGRILLQVDEGGDAFDRYKKEVG
ncbi:hypothetical protein ABE458_31455 [Pseudomonas protegens]|uniref:hypothetical protein n=1 Tax=Pseudomonas protegens TaxID=380021 RepID=UPI003207E27E